MAFVLLSLLVAACLAPTLMRRFPGQAWMGLASVPALSAVYLLSAYSPTSPTVWSMEWVPGLGIDLALRLDGLSMVFSLLVCGVGALILAYTSSYLHGDDRMGRLFSLLLFFQTAMLGLVLADDAITLFVFWEGTSIVSYLLIGFDHHKETSRASAFRALFVTGAGGLAMLVGLLWATNVSGSSQLSTWNETGLLLSDAAYPSILVLILLGAFTKSAQFPFHFWLPGAMAAPTPVSAYLHSATMVKAGVYLLMRLQPALGGTQLWHALLTSVGGVTFLLGAWLAVGQKDMKRLLAFTTVGGLGTLITLLGIGTEAAITAALVFLLVHALYKGALFLTTGILDHETGTRDLTVLRGMRGAMPKTFWVALLACASMAGLPPLLGFLGKELIYEAQLHAPFLPELLITAGVAGNVFFVAAAFTILLGVFFGRQAETPNKPHDPPLPMLLPPAILAVVGLVLGAFPGTFTVPIVKEAISVVRGEETAVKLYLWHGFNFVLLLSFVTLMLGIAVYLARPFLARKLRPLFAAETPLVSQLVFERFIAACTGFAKLQTGWIAGGTLRNNVRVFLTTAIGLVAFAVAWMEGPRLPEWGELGVGQAEAVLITGLGTLAVVLARGQVAARVALIGVVGLGVSLTFLASGGLDLALTQLSVETLAVLLFAFVLLRLPRSATRSTPAERGRDAFLAIIGGLLMTSLVWTCISSPAGTALTDGFVERSLPEGKGRNVVNVVLVDFRALDTLGEITVLALAALGVLSLLRRARRPESDLCPR